jgi:phenylacetate-CoA ligase
MTAADTPYVTLDIARVREHAGGLLERSDWSRPKLLAYQQERLDHALRHAVETSPYYREKLGDLVARGAPLHEFPVLTKRDLMANFDRIVADPQLTRNVIERHVDGPDCGTRLFGRYHVAATGGTSGERGMFAYGDDGWLSVIANIVRFQRMLGVTPAIRNIGIGAPSPIHLSYRFYAELRAGRPEVPQLDVTMPVAHVVEALNRYQPEALTTYPSFMRVLAHEQQSGRLRIAPRFFRSGAETLLPEVREIVRATWNIPVFNGYASTEVGVMAQECPHQTGLHLAEDLTVYEVADEQDRPLGAGVPGRKLLVTTLTNPVLPLIRYELTDIVALAKGDCPCGLPFARLQSVEGRREEVLQFAQADRIIEIHAIRLHSPLIGMEGLRQFQLAHDRDRLAISISLHTQSDSQAMRRKVDETIRAVLAKLGVADLAIDVTVVDEIARVGTAAKEKLFVRPAKN